MEQAFYNYCFCFGLAKSLNIWGQEIREESHCIQDIYISLLEDDEGMSTEAGRVRNCMIQKCYWQPKSHSGTKKINRHSEKS